MRVYDVDSNSVESKFWELYEVYNAEDPENFGKGATGKNSYEGMMKTLEKYYYIIKSIIGFSADGCSVMMETSTSKCPGLVVIVFVTPLTFVLVKLARFCLEVEVGVITDFLLYPF